MFQGLGLDGGEKYFELMSSISEDWVVEKIFRADVGYFRGIGWWRKFFRADVEYFRGLGGGENFSELMSGVF